MLYKKNKAKTLSKELFENPTEEYRGAPFWSWNCKITKDILRKQTKYFKEMGFGGFDMHCRTGLDVPYLSDEFMELIRYCAELAEKQGQLAWLYDEDRYPSGAAGGLVTKDPQYRARFLKMTREDLVDGMVDKETAVKEGKYYFYHAYDIIFDDEGRLVSYKKIGPKDKAQGKKWFTYVGVPEPRGWFNNLTYVDTMSKGAMDRFIEVTHERYKEAVGQYFDGVVPAIFTDEPQVDKKQTFAYGNSEESVTLPWTPEMDDLYEKRYGVKIEDTLPEIFWDKADGTYSRARYLYHDFVCEVFTSSFSDNLGSWCEKNGIALTGHVMGEQWLKTQTEHLGEAMRCYRGFNLPGIDMLSDDREYNTAKQCQSAVHQYGREGMLSELYGVTGWDYDFRGHKSQGDWQAALGVTVRVPHLSWMSMHGDAKRDYPASIFYQSPWYKEYKFIEDHYARLNTALTRGRPVVDVAVIHSIESYWLNWGPSQNTADVRDQIESNHMDLVSWLHSSQIDFDFISESLLPELYKGTEGGFNVGKMTYKTVIVPPLETIRKTTLKALSDYQEAGGRVLFMGKCPEYVDALPSKEARKLYDRCEKTEFLKYDIIEALKPERRIELMNSDGTRSGEYFYNYRRDNDCDWLFIARSNKIGRQYGGPGRLTLRIKGKFTPEVYDTLTGRIRVPEYRVDDDNTYIDFVLYAMDSVLLRLGRYDKKIKGEKEPKVTVIGTYSDKKPVKYSLSEDNAMVLDEAEFRIDSKSLRARGEWRGIEELTRIHNIALAECGLPRYDDAQPWVEPPEKLEHTVDLKFEFDSEIDYEGAYLALENAELCEVVLNGAAAGKKIEGYFTDEAIRKVKLPKIQKGKNTLLVRTPVGIRTKIEWCYMLGKFGVKIKGIEKTVTEIPKVLGYSDLTRQDLPFYTGNVKYFETVDVPEGCDDLSVRISEFTGALVKVYVDGKCRGIIFSEPFCARLGHFEPGKHKITLEYFGTRENAFGGLHNADVNERWKGPNIWQTEGNKFCYEYRIKTTGITAAPVYYFGKTEK